MRDRLLPLLILAITALGSCKDTSQDATGTFSMKEDTCRLSPRLISPDQLFEELGKEQIALIEVSQEEDFAKGHIEGATRVWRPDYSAKEGYEYGGMRGGQSMIEALLQSCGVNKEDKLILYDRRGDVDAARLAWLIGLYGHRDLFLLDGGLHRWQAAGYPLSQEISTLTQVGDFQFPDSPAPAIIIDKEDVMAAIENDEWIILDTRTTAEYKGEITKKGAFRPGHIPGSLHLDWMEMIHHEDDYRFLTCEEIQPKLDALGITPEHHIITYCHSGVRSAHMAFVLTEIMGYKQVWNYDGSWTEWSFFSELPAVVLASASTQ